MLYNIKVYSVFNFLFWEIRRVINDNSKMKTVCRNNILKIFCKYCKYYKSSDIVYRYISSRCTVIVLYDDNAVQNKQWCGIIVIVNVLYNKILKKYC